MKSRSDEVIRQLTRLANDRSLPLQARNRINDAVRHLRELQAKLARAENLGEA